jgi:acyl carrier protein
MNTVPGPATLSHEQVVAVIADALGRIFDREPPEAGPGIRLFEELGLDSTRVLELLLELEGDLGIEFDADTLEPDHFQTLGTLADYVLIQTGA